MSRQRFLRQATGHSQPALPDIETMREWLAAAQPGAYLEYHRGRNLAAERRDSADLTARATQAPTGIKPPRGRAKAACPRTMMNVSASSSA